MNKKKSISVVLILLIPFLLFSFRKKEEPAVKENLNKIFFNKAFVISLDRTPERWTASKKVLLESGLTEEQIERFSATDGLNIKIYDYQNKKIFTGKDLKEKKNTFVHKNKYKIKCNDEISFDYTAYNQKFDPNYWADAKLKIYNATFMTAGEFGCTCSHLRAMKEAQKRNYENIIIFEDDVLISKNKKKNFNLNLFLIENSKEINHCDITFLYSYLLFKRKLSNKIKVYLWQFFAKNQIINYLNSPYKDFWVTAAYIPSKKFIDTIIHYKEINIPIDRLYSQLIFKEKTINGCFTKPLIFNHPDITSASTISEMGR